MLVIFETMTMEPGLTSHCSLTRTSEMEEAWEEASTASTASRRRDALMADTEIKFIMTRMEVICIKLKIHLQHHIETSYRATPLNDKADTSCQKPILQKSKLQELQ